MRLLSILLFFIFCSPTIVSQNDIREFQYSPDSISITESTPIYISDTEMIMFFCSPKNDTIYISKTTDGGINWSVPVFVIETQVITEGSEIFLRSLLTPTNRIILCWSVPQRGMYSIYSDDYGINWSQPVLILGGLSGGITRRNFNINLSQITDNKIWLSMNHINNGGFSFYRESTDNGVSWGDNTSATIDTFSMSTTPSYSDVSFIGLSETEVLAFYQSNSSEEQHIYMRRSTDGGNSWGTDELITGTEQAEKRPRAIKSSDGKIYLVYQREYETIKQSIIQNDIFYKTSTDGGSTWSEEQRFTKYIGDDSYLNISKNNRKPLISFVTQRFRGTYEGRKIGYAILGETVEQYTPPVIYDFDLSWVGFEKGNPLTINVSIFADDDEAIGEIYIIDKDSQRVDLFDDGMHEDGEAGDKIYGNKYYLNDFIDGSTNYFSINKIKFPISSTGALAGLIYEAPIYLDARVGDLQGNISNKFNLFNYGLSPTGYYDDVGFLFSGGFLLSGYSNGNLWGFGTAVPALIENCVPGRVNDSSNPKNLTYSINADDPPFGMKWQRWKDAVDIGADFYDGDGDGIYNPVDLNNNGIWDPTEDMPDVLGDRTVWTVFNDGQPGNERTRFGGVDPQGVEIAQTVFASSDPELENIVFVRYRLTNRGTVADILDSVIIGLWADPDLGNYDDDAIGCDTLLKSSFCYNSDDDDSTFWGRNYGTNPPAFFTTLLQGVQSVSQQSDTAYVRNGPQIGEELILGSKNVSINAFIHNISSDPERGGPYDEMHLRNLMLGRFYQGSLFDPCEPDVFGAVFGGVDCNSIDPHFWYSGDPVTNTGWINATGTDQRMMLSTEQFDLIKDEPVDIIFAYVMGRGTDRLTSVTIARENVQRAIQEYQSNFSSLAYDPGEPNIVIDNYELFQNYPNPFNPTTTIRYDVLADGIVTLKVYDILGQEVRTLVNEFKPARRYEVNFSSKGLASGVYIYRLQVNGFDQSKKMIILK